VQAELNGCGVMGSLWQLRPVLRGIPPPLGRCLPLLGLRVRALLGCLGLIAHLVVQVCELVVELGDALVKVSGLSPRVGGGFPRMPCFGRSSAGPQLGLAAQLFEQPDPLNQLLSLGRVHIQSWGSVRRRSFDAWLTRT
jgi:hypothetical protein